MRRGRGRLRRSLSGLPEELTLRKITCAPINTLPCVCVFSRLLSDWNVNLHVYMFLCLSWFLLSFSWIQVLAALEEIWFLNAPGQMLSCWLCVHGVGYEAHKSTEATFTCLPIELFSYISWGFGNHATVGLYNCIN